MHQGHRRHLHPEVACDPGRSSGAPSFLADAFGATVSGLGISGRFAGQASCDALRRTHRGWPDNGKAMPTRSQIDRPAVDASASQLPVQRIALIGGQQRACLAGQRDRPADRARRLSAGHHPAQRSEMVGDLRRQPLGGARGDQDADGQEPAGIAAEDRQLGRAEGALEPARSRCARLVRDRRRTARRSCARCRSSATSSSRKPPPSPPMRRTDEQMAEISQACREMGERRPRSERTRADTRFHLAILRASGNDLLVPLGVLIESALDHLFVFVTREAQRPAAVPRTCTRRSRRPSACSGRRRRATRCASCSPTPTRSSSATAARRRRFCRQQFATRWSGRSKTHGFLLAAAFLAAPVRLSLHSQQPRQANDKEAPRIPRSGPDRAPQADVAAVQLDEARPESPPAGYATGQSGA